MKILFVNNSRGRGGGEEFLRDLLPGLVAKGVPVDLVCRPETPLVEMFKNSEVVLHPVDSSGMRRISAVFKTAQIIREGNYNIVNIQRGHDILQSWLGRVLSGKRPILIYTVQVAEFLKWRFLLSRMSRIVTISRHISDRILFHYPRIASRLSIIYYGIDLNKFRTGNIRGGLVRERFKLPSDAPLIGTVGDLWKNQIEFLDALVLIRREVPTARFVLVASDSNDMHVEAFKRQAAELNLSDALVWTGRLSKDDMHSFYSDIDLAVSTHRNEGFGIWVLEALAMGTPVVSVNEGGIRDSLEGCPAGVLVDGGPAQMAAEVVRILKDRALRTRMKEAGPAWTAARYSRERMVEDYVRFFRALATEGETRVAGESRPLNILQIISKNDRYGAQRIFLDQIASLRDMGHKITAVVRGTQGYVTDSVRAMGLECHGIPMKGIADILYLRRLVRDRKINIIHSMLDRADYYGLILSWITRLPIVSTMMVPRCHPGYRFMDGVITLANKQAELLTDYGVNARRISVIRPGIDVARFSRPDPVKAEAWKKKLRLENFSTVFCHIASIQERKAHMVSYKLVHECKKRGEEPLLIIIGDPVPDQLHYYESLLKKGSEYGIKDNVFFTGWTSDIPEILSLSHFTVLPSEKEALGIVLMEGMAAGTPIIAREGEGGAELIEQYGTGFLYKPEEGVSTLADRIITLWRDTSRYREISRKCKEIGEQKFSLHHFGELLVETYQKAGAAGHKNISAMKVSS